MDQEQGEYELLLESELEDFDLELELYPDVSEIGVGGRPSEQPLAPADVHVSKETSKSVVEAHSAGHNHDAPVNVKKKQKSRPQRIVRPDPSCTLEQVLLTANDILQGALHKDLGDIKETPLGQGITSLLNKLGPIQVGDDTFAAYLMRELWAIAGSGDHLPVGVAANSLMWSSFHKFRVGQKVQDMWNTFLKVKGMKDAEKSTSDMLLQQVLQNSLSSVISMRSVTSTAEAECSYELTNHDEQVLKYVAGFVPFALCKRFRRYQSDNAAQFVHFLQSLHAEGDDETTAESFMSYRCVWTTLQNRGGLFIVNDSAYKFFRTMEVETRKHLSSDFLLKGRDEALTAKLTESISCSVHVQRLWDNMQGDELTNGQVLLKTIINYWVAIRLRAFVKVFLEEKRAAQNKQRREKGLRKELRRKSKQTE